MGERTVKLIAASVTTTAVEYLTYASEYSGNVGSFDRSTSAEPATSYTIITSASHEVVDLKVLDPIIVQDSFECM